MKVALLVQKKMRVILDRLYESIAAHSTHCDILWLDDKDQRDLKGYFRNNIDTQKYDRIVVFLRFKKMIRQRQFLRTIPNLVFFEHDAWFNYRSSKYRGEFSRHYRAMPWARVICSGYGVTQKLRAEGFDAVFVPKGYDQTLLRNLQQPRTIELAFVGSTQNKLYAERSEFLAQLATAEPMQIVRTKSGEEYLQKLNAIRFFVSADINFDEYMIKNFEAMACGCVLLAFNQGDEENAALGFEDMKSIVLYKDIAELQQKLRLLRADAALCASIAAHGQALAETHFTFAEIGRQVADALRTPLRQHGAGDSRKAATVAWLEALRYKILRR
jgi:glycosyltransferase involved in cell wall biosynthesis